MHTHKLIHAHTHMHACTKQKRHNAVSGKTPEDCARPHLLPLSRERLAPKRNSTLGSVCHSLLLDLAEEAQETRIEKNRRHTPTCQCDLVYCLAKLFSTACSLLAHPFTLYLSHCTLPLDLLSRSLSFSRALSLPLLLCFSYIQILHVVYPLKHFSILYDIFPFLAPHAHTYTQAHARASTLARAVSLSCSLS